MQHPGLDISNVITDSVALQQEAIKGVNWLTVLSEEFADRIGGRAALTEALPHPIEVIPVKAGLILKAGPEPGAGDLDSGDILPEYRAVYQIVSPLQEPLLGRYGSFTLPGGRHRELTQAWLERFADE